MAKDPNDNKTIDGLSPVLDTKEIKKIIKELGWTQVEIAEYWGVSRNWVYLLIKNEHGQRSVRDDCAFRGLPKKI
jgi:DNA-binding XRE family transcriptional regulator